MSELPEYIVNYCELQTWFICSQNALDVILLHFLVSSSHFQHSQVHPKKRSPEAPSRRSVWAPHSWSPWHQLRETPGQSWSGRNFIPAQLCQGGGFSHQRSSPLLQDEWSAGGQRQRYNRSMFSFQFLWWQVCYWMMENFFVFIRLVRLSQANVALWWTYIVVLYLENQIDKYFGARCNFSSEI